MSKEIRILTGTHAGATLQMAPGLWTVGSGESTDVQVSDWTHAQVALEIAADGSVTCITAGTDGPGLPVADLQPLRFGDIVLCIGDAAADWPEDADLLAKLDAPAEVPETAELAELGETSAAVHTARSPKQPRRWLFAGGTALVVTAASAAFLPSQTSQATVLPSSATLLQKVRNELAAAHQDELNAQLEGDRIVVHGMVRGHGDAIAVKEMLRRIAPTNSLVDFTDVADVIANIQDSVHDSAVKVRYEGKGVFSVSGAVRSVAAVQKTVSQVEADVGPGVKIVQNVTLAAQRWDVADSESALVSGSLQYVQAVDGSKHFPPSQY